MTGVQSNEEGLLWTSFAARWRCLSGVIGAGFASGQGNRALFRRSRRDGPYRRRLCACRAAGAVRASAHPSGRRRRRPAFPACAGRASGGASAGCAAHCSFCSPPSQAARCSRPARSFPRSSGRSATPMPSASPSRRCSPRCFARLKRAGWPSSAAALCGLLPILLIRLLLLLPGEACFLPEGPAGRRSPRGAGRHALRRAERRHDGGRAAHAADPVRAAAAGVRRARRPALRRHADAGHARLSAPDAERAHAAAPLRLAQPRPRRGRLSARRAVPVCGGAVHPVRHALRNDECFCRAFWRAMRG